MQTLISKTNEFKLYNLILWPDVQSGGGCWYIFLNEFMSEWVSDCWFKCQLNFFTAISWREQVNFEWDDDEVHFVLDQYAKLDFYSASLLKQQSADRHVAPLGHIILIKSQPVFALFLNSACLAEKTTIYPTWG
jgi:hypothetical protein